MNDREFLIWLHARLEKVHGEDPLVDYMRKLRAIIRATPKDKLTPNVVGCNSLVELDKELEAPNPTNFKLKPNEYMYVTNPNDGSISVVVGKANSLYVSI
jgi:hypothetical protein